METWRPPMNSFECFECVLWWDACDDVLIRSAGIHLFSIVRFYFLFFTVSRDYDGLTHSTSYSYEKYEAIYRYW